MAGSGLPCFQHALNCLQAKLSLNPFNLHFLPDFSASSPTFLSQPGFVLQWPKDLSHEFLCTDLPRARDFEVMHVQPQKESRQSLMILQRLLLGEEAAVG